MSTLAKLASSETEPSCGTIEVCAWKRAVSQGMMVSAARNVSCNKHGRLCFCHEIFNAATVGR